MNGHVCLHAGGGCGALLSDAEAFASHCGEVEHDDDFAYAARWRWRGRVISPHSLKWRHMGGLENMESIDYAIYGEISQKVGD